MLLGGPSGDDTEQISEDVRRHLARQQEWDEWREWMDASRRPAESRNAGLWALSVLEQQLGSDWLGTAIKLDGSPPPFIVGAAHWNTAYGELLRFALLLDWGRGVPGFARIRREIQKDPRDSRIWHGLLQLELAALASRCGAGVAFESTLQNGRSPTDVAITWNASTIGVEVFAMYPDSAFRSQHHFDSHVLDLIRNIEIRFGVIIDVEFSPDFCEDDIPSFIEAATGTAKGVDSSRQTGTVQSRAFDMKIVPMNSELPGGQVTLPVRSGQGWPRVAERIGQKAAQAANAGASWLRMDLYEATWQLTSWAQMRLHDKVNHLASALSPLFANNDFLRGIVASSGATMALQSRSGETTWPLAAAHIPGGVAVGLRRNVDPLNCRETIIVGRSDEFGALQLFYQAYDVEEELLDALLRAAGFAPLAELWKPPS